MGEATLWALELLSKRDGFAHKVGLGDRSDRRNRLFCRANDLQAKTWSPPAHGFKSRPSPFLTLCRSPRCQKAGNSLGPLSFCRRPIREIQSLERRNGRSLSHRPLPSYYPGDYPADANSWATAFAALASSLSRSWWPFNRRMATRAGFFAPSSLWILPARRSSVFTLSLQVTIRWNAGGYSQSSPMTSWPHRRAARNRQTGCHSI